PTTRFLVDVGLDDGGRIAAEGSAARDAKGISGWVTADAGEIGVRRFSRYTENASDLSLDAGKLGVVVAADLAQDQMSGQAKITLRGLRVHRLTDHPGARVAQLVTVQRPTTAIT